MDWHNLNTEFNIAGSSQGKGFHILNSDIVFSEVISLILGSTKQNVLLIRRRGGSKLVFRYFRKEDWFYSEIKRDQ